MADNLKITMQDYMPLRDVVFNTLREAIIKGDLKPGERLLEIQLSESMGVSRTPVREAIRKLELEGLVVMIPRRGATVAGITQNSLREVLEIRKALEILAIELACERMSQELYEQLEDKEKLFEEKIDTDDVTQLADDDEAFHNIIYQSTSNNRLISILANLREQMYRYRLECLKDKNQRHELVKEHRLILEAIRMKNIKAATDAAYSHIKNQENTILKNL